MSTDVAGELKRSWELWRLIPIDEVHADYCRNLLRGQLFTDHFFPPTTHSIQGDNRQSLSTETITWKRPREFAKGTPLLFKDSIDPRDIKQGVLGDCWFLGAVSALAESPQFIQRLFPDGDALRDIGMFRVHLFKDGEEQTVVVDDYIPCSSRGPVFSKCNDGELWVAVLEKAYAKLHGSYANLLGGFPQDSFTDLSGCPTWSYQFDSPELAGPLQSGSFWRDLLGWHQAKYCLATSSRPDESLEARGLVPGHAYTIIRVVTVNEVNLVQLRNPWGRFEWKGAWSDSSSLWTESFRSALRPDIGADDGCFWMCFADLIQHFSSAEVCKVAAYHTTRFKVHIHRDESVGARPSHYLYIQVNTHTRAVLGCHQEDQRTVGVEEYRRYLDMGLLLFRVAGAEQSIYAYAEAKDDREVFLEVDLQPGFYVLCPLSTGGALRRPSDARPQSFPFSTANNDLHPFFLSIVKDIFRRFDQDCSQELEYDEFSHFADLIGFPMTKPEFDEKVRARFTSYERGVKMQGFIELFQEELRKKREPLVRTWLQRLGYDQDCYSIQSRAIVLTVQTLAPVQVSRKPMENTGLLMEGWRQLCVGQGSPKQLSSGLQVYSLTQKQAGVQTVMLNNQGQDLWKVRMDFTSSEGVEFVLNQEKVVERIVPGQGWQLIQHLKRVRSSPSASFGYRVVSEPYRP